MKKISTLLIIAIILTSCTKKKVFLPETTNQEITKILDVSPVYIFYDESKPDNTDFNRKNMIGSTNWLVNIDKRLTLKQILPHLQYLQEKRNKDGMHKNINAKNYFSCSNPEIQNLAFIEFTNVVYNGDGFNIFADNLMNNQEDQELNVTSIKFNANQTYDVDNFNYPNKDFSQHFEKMAIKDIVPLGVYLIFDENMTFQDYISIKSTLLKSDLGKTIIDKNEFINN